jgi:flagellar basal body-associated protein FliL
LGLSTRTSPNKESGEVTVSILLLIVAVVLFLIGAVVAFGWFGTEANLANVLGLFGLGSAAFAAAHLPV